MYQVILSCPIIWRKRKNCKQKWSSLLLYFLLYLVIVINLFSGLFTPTIIKVTAIVWTIVFVKYCTGGLLQIWNIFVIAIMIHIP